MRPAASGSATSASAARPTNRRCAGLLLTSSCRCCRLPAAAPADPDADHDAEHGGAICLWGCMLGHGRPNQLTSTSSSSLKLVLLPVDLHRRSGRSGVASTPSATAPWSPSSPPASSHRPARAAAAGNRSGSGRGTSGGMSAAAADACTAPAAAHASGGVGWVGADGRLHMGPWLGCALRRCACLTAATHASTPRPPVQQGRG